jgi:O-antigen biosynthesis protein
VVIATVGRPDVLDRCLSALASAGDVPYDAVVVDNTSGDPGTQLLARRHGARCLTAVWTGLSGARNAGIRASTGPIVAFLDDDAAPMPGWLAALLAPFADPMVMAVTGRVFPFKAEAEARLRMGIAVDQDLGPQARVVDRTTDRWFEICNFGGLGIGANMAFRRESFEVWPGFRESLGRGTPMQGGEEHNAFFELVRRGYRVAYTPQATVEHRYPHTLPSIRRNHFRYLAGATAYATLLVVEEPGYRRRTLRYMIEAMLGRKRAWRLNEGPHSRAVLPGAVRFLAYLCGPPLYVLSLAWVGASRLGARLSGLLRRG